MKKETAGSMRNTILNGLMGYAVYKVEVDRDSDISGTPAIKVTVHRADGRDAHEFQFAKANLMTASNMLDVIKSYLRRVG